MTEKPKSCFHHGLAVTFLVLGLDQLSKYIILESLHIQSESYIQLLPFFNLVLVWNSGVSFGMLAGHGGAATAVLTIATTLIAIVLIEWMRRAPDYVTTLALAAIVGGAFGNIIDRLRFMAVVDFLDFHLGAYHWPAFNIADASIFLGVVVLAWGSIFSGQKQGAQP